MLGSGRLRWQRTGADIKIKKQTTQTNKFLKYQHRPLGNLSKSSFRKQHAKRNDFATEEDFSVLRQFKENSAGGRFRC